VVCGSEIDGSVTVRTVLIAEDEWAIADWLEALLSEKGYKVLVASNGREALDILHRETPDLCLPIS
jgi:two-component system chemotaxis sensor kinase CheA